MVGVSRATLLQEKWEVFPFQLEPKAAPSSDLERKIISESGVFISVTLICCNSWKKRT